MKNVTPIDILRAFQNLTGSHPTAVINAVFYSCGSHIREHLQGKLLSKCNKRSRKGAPICAVTLDALYDFCVELDSANTMLVNEYIKANKH